MLQHRNRHFLTLCTVLTLCILIVSLALPGSVRQARAATLMVTNLNDSGSGSFRQAIIDSASGDTGLFDPNLSGTLYYFGGVITISRNVVVIGNGSVIIDGRRSTNLIRIINNAAVTFKNITFQRASSTVIFTDGPVTLINCIVRDTYGVGLTIEPGPVFEYGYTLINVTMTNIIGGFGGAIFDDGNSPGRIIGSTFANNRASVRGGAILHASGQPLIIENTLFTGNYSPIGGAIFSAYSRLDLNYSIIFGNRANSGGGIYLEDSQGSPGSVLNLFNSLVSENSAVGSGGGIHSPGAVVNSLNSTIAYNQSIGGYGGGLYMGNTSYTDAAATITNTTIAYNQAQSTGGGIYVDSGALTLKNSLIAENTSLSSPDLVAVFTSQGYNLVQTRGSSFGYVASDLADGTDPKLQPELVWLGGSTLILDTDMTSPVRDAVSASNCAGITLDQRGFVRPANGLCDIGAVEYNAFAPTATSTPNGYETATSTRTSTATRTNTVTGTATLPSSATSTQTNTATITSTPSNSATPTRTSTVTPTASTTLTPSKTNTPIPPRVDTIGAFKDGVFYLRNTNTSGPADIIAAFGSASDLPTAGDWDGDGVDTIGSYRGSEGKFYLSNSNPNPAVNYAFFLGNPGDTPFAGKWRADMTHDGAGVYRNSNGILYQKKELTTGFADYFAIFGNPGDVGIAGDWNGDGLDSVGIYRSAEMKWYLTNNSEPNGVTYADLSFVWNANGTAPVVGDWDGNLSSTPGYLTMTGTFVLHPANASAGLDNVFSLGLPGSKPIAGKWIAGSAPGQANVIGGGNPRLNLTSDGSINKLD